MKIEARILAALDARRFDVVILASGTSLNRMAETAGGEPRPIYYSEELLSSPETVALFEGAAVNAHGFGDSFDHIGEGDKSLFSMNTVGVLEGVHYGEGALRGRLVLHEGADFMAGLLKLSTERDDPLVGLSIDATGEIKFTAREGVGDVAEVATFGPSPTVDVVSRPAAGGEIVRIAASFKGGGTIQEGTMPIEDPAPPAAQMTEAEVNALVAKQLAEAVKEAEDKAKAKQILVDEAKAELTKKLNESADLLTKTLADSNLPDKAQDIIRLQFADRTFEASELKEALAAVRKFVSDVDKSGSVNLPAVEVGMEDQERATIALTEAFTRNGWKTQPNPVTGETVKGMSLAAKNDLRESGADPVRSLLGFARDTFGLNLADRAVGGERRRKLTESLTTSSWDKVFEDALHKAMIAYSENPKFDSWRAVCTVESVPNYEAMKRIRDYGYPNLDIVTEGANYQAITSPGDDSEEFTMVKYGNTEDFTEEMVLADQLGRIAAIPQKLGMAAARTRYETIWDYITISGQPTLADGNTLFYARSSPNGNLGTTALSSAQFVATRLLMQKYADISTSKRLGVTPAYLAVPIDLFSTAFEMFRSITENHPGSETASRAFDYSVAPTIIPVEHWTNAKDHVYIAEPSEITGLIAGFLQGNEQPQLYTQDDANNGSVFARDAVTYKIKLPLAVGIGAYQAFFGADVA